MIAGLPGTGIGGLFYLLSALLMPVRELWRASIGTGQSSDRRLALRQSGMALAIMGAIWLTGLALTLLHVGNMASPTGALRIFYITPALISFGTLTLVLLGVEVVSASIKVGARIQQQLSDQAPASGGDR